MHWIPCYKAVKINYLTYTKIRYLCQVWSYQTSFTTRVIKQNKCPGETAAILDTSQENQLVGFRLVQTQSCRIKHYWVGTKVWFWLKTALYCQPPISSILQYSVPHLLLAFDMGYAKKEEEWLTWYFGHWSFGSENEEDELIELSNEEELSPPGFSWQHFPKTLTWASLQSFWNTDNICATLRPTTQNHCLGALHLPV